MPDNNPDFNEILEKIQREEQNSMYAEEEEKPAPKYDNITEYVLEKGAKLLESNIDVIERVKNRISTAHDPDELNTLSTLFKSSNSLLSTLTTIAIQNKKDVATRELAANKQNGLPHTVNNTVFIGTRDEMLKKALTKDCSADVEVSKPEYKEEE